jgi:hypothetical protein
MEFAATRKHVAVSCVFFFLRAIEASYVCACDLEGGALQLPGKLKPLWSCARCGANVER